jgi:CheY-like chemotaxis protein
VNDAERKPTILVVDDEQNMLLTVQFLLEAAGYRLLAAASAAEALQRLEGPAAFPDLLITDIQMPGTTGLELLEALRRLRPDLPVLVMTGYWSKELGRRLSELHCRQWIEKPFEEEQLLEKVREMLRAQEETP